MTRPTSITTATGSRFSRSPVNASLVPVTATEIFILLADAESALLSVALLSPPDPEHHHHQHIMRM